MAFLTSIRDFHILYKPKSIIRSYGTVSSEETGRKRIEYGKILKAIMPWDYVCFYPESHGTKIRG